MNLKSLLLVFTYCAFGILNAQENNWISEPLPPQDLTQKPELSEAADCGDPFFVGGREVLIAYLQKNIKIPDNCIKQSVSAKLWIKLLIDTVGKVSRVELKSADFLTEKCKVQIQQIFYEMPLWNPGIIDGKVSNRFFSLPITIEFTED